MTKILKNCNYDVDSDEYLKTVNHIHQQFEKLEQLLGLYSMKNSIEYLKTSYDYFSKDIEQDLKYKN